MSDDSADGAAYERLEKRYVAKCLICPWTGRRSDTQSDAFTNMAGHFRNAHPESVTLRTYKHLTVWEPVETN